VLAGEGTAPYLASVPPSYNAPYYAVAHLWLLLTPFGLDEVGLRLLSLVAGVGAVAVLTRAVQRLAGTAVGLAAGLLAAANPLVVEYAAEARGYSLALLATATALLGLARWLDGDGLLLYGLGAAAMGLAHWFALPALAGMALGAALLRRRPLRPLVLVTGLAVLPTAALVVLAVANGAGGDNVGFIRDTGLRLPELAARAWSGGSALLLVLTLAAVAAGLVRGGRVAVVAGAWLAVPLLALTVVQLARPVFVPRYLLPSLLALAVLAALGRRRGGGRSPWGPPPGCWPPRCGPGCRCSTAGPARTGGRPWPTCRASSDRVSRSWPSTPGPPSRSCSTATRWRRSSCCRPTPRPRRTSSGCCAR
jgi:hypothetical protein